VEYVKGLLDQIGLGGDRLEMHFISSAMGREFAERATQMRERIKQVGPSPLRKKRE
jgi:F420-non-reducing hydrogenase iron-sulfur subunit